MADVAPSNPQNEVHQQKQINRSKFPFGFRFYDTHRFGEVHPFYVAETVPSDKFVFRPSQKVMSYTMGAPLMDELSQRQFLSFVPMEAILPLNWDKFYTNPVQGDDVPDDVGCCSVDFWNRVSGLILKFHDYLFTSSSPLITNGTNVQRFTSVLRYMQLIEWFFSNGSLLSTLGVQSSYRYQMLEQDGKIYSADQVYDRLAAAFVNNFASFQYNRTGERLVYVDTTIDSNQLTDPRDDRSNSAVSFRTFLSIFRDNPSGSFDVLSFVSGKSITTFVSDVQAAVSGQLTILLGDGETSSSRNGTQPLNLSRLWAYQLVSAEYFTNDHVDYLYDSNLFRQYIWQLFLGTSSFSSRFSETFTVNGLTYQYDALSGHILDSMLTIAEANINFILNSTSGFVSLWSYFAALFSFRPSLRFKDYFTGSRTQPLAIDGSNQIDINSSGSISVIDVTKGIARQRMLNAANVAGRRIKDYVKQLYGIEMATDWHRPQWLAEKSQVIFGDQVQNTGAAQLSERQSITQTLRSMGNQFQYEMTFDRDGIFLAVNYYDIPRAYTKTTDRQTLIKSRYDMFNPYMQFIGDQPVYSVEIGNGYPSIAQAWSYTGQNMEYKQRFNRAAGGFVENLPGWCFLADRVGRSAVAALSPEYIRSVPSELDYYYVRLTGYSLGSYFHFIVKSENVCDAIRPMAYSPGILTQ